MSEERYQRQEQIPEYASFAEKVRQLRVGIIGAGGIGGLTAYLLVGAGLRQLKLADGDVVSLSNLHRQILYSLKDVGRDKTACARSVLQELDPRLQLETCGRLTQEQLPEFAKDCNLIMDLSDNLETRLMVNRVCLKLRLDYLHASVAAEQALMCLFRFSSPDFIKRFGCYNCLCGDQLRLRPQGITGPYAATVAGYAANLAMQYLNGSYEGTGELMQFNFKHFSVHRFKLHPDRHCRCCREEDFKKEV